MTEADIDAMTAGRDLDAMIAVKVMGWKSADPKMESKWLRESGLFDPSDPKLGWGVDPKGMELPLPYYSNDMANAMPVFEVIKVWQPDCLFEIGQLEGLVLGWNGVRHYYAAYMIDQFCETSTCYTVANAESMAEAVCKVALKAALKLEELTRPR